MKAVLILSGGVDSTTLLYKMLDDGYDVDALTFDYAQRHKKEIDCAREVTARLHVTHRIIDLSCLARSWATAPFWGKGCAKLPLHRRGRQEDHCAQSQYDHALRGGRLRRSARDPEIFYAAHRNDATIYPDCRAEFVEALKPAIRLATAWHPVELRAPFVDLTKAEIVKIGLELGFLMSLPGPATKERSSPADPAPPASNGKRPLRSMNA